MIKLVRIDDRLIHGQVAYTWTTYLGVNVILIANDAVIHDEFKKMTLNLAKPAGVKLMIKSVEDSIRLLNSPESKNNKFFVLVDNSLDALSIVQNVPGVPAVNVGGMRMKDGKKMKTPAVAVDAADISHFKEIESLGVEVEVRQVPVEKKKSIDCLL